VKMDLIIYWRFESPGRISDLMLYFHLSHRPYKCTPLNPRYAPFNAFLLTFSKRLLLYSFGELSCELGN